MPSHYVFRASGLPMDATPSDFQELRRFLQDGEELNLIDESIVPSCLLDDTLTGLFGVKPPLPSFLDKQTSGSTPIFSFSLRCEDVEIDRNFYGFTQLYPTEPEKPIVADIIAVPGLDGHAYGSWKGKGDLQRMWLRDFFPKHFPNCRTMTYGYNANLRSKSVHTILDFSRTFLRSLQDVRSSDMESKRPLLFIGHSYGGILLAHTLVKAKFETTGDNGPSDSLLKATYGILFFGTPHRGMLVQNLLDAVEQTGHVQRKELLEEIQHQSKTLAAELIRFIDLCSGFKIYSFYETNQTRQIVIGTDESWSREGEFATAVEDISALLQLPKSIEEPIPVDADHSNLVKFETANSSTYREVRKIIGGMLSEAPEAVANRFFAKVPVHFCVPFARNEGYIGRPEKNASIRDALSVQAGGHRRLALWGLGGVGKTQDVLDYVYELQGQVSVFWIYAGNKARFEQDYRKIAVLLQLPGHDNLKTDIRPAVKSWFEGSASGRWILVLDNADNVLDFYPISPVTDRTAGEEHSGNELAQFVPHNVLDFDPQRPVTDRTGEEHSGNGLAQFVPHGSKGTVIVTTRDNSLADKLSGMNVLSKGEMDADEAMQLFTKHYPDAVGDETSSMRLLEELQYLPLAIVQAAAYLRLQNRVLRPSGYLQQFKATKEDQRTLLSKPFCDHRRESGAAAAETILTTFAITFKQIESQWPLAGSFLEIMACIDRQGIPGDLFRESDGLGINAAGEALSKLIDFALITQAAIGEDSSFVMHALVHVSIQEFLSTRERMQAAMNKTGKILRKILPNGEYKNWSVSKPAHQVYMYEATGISHGPLEKVWKTYLPHALAWTANIPILSEQTAAIYIAMSGYLRSIGRYKEAKNKAEIAADIIISIRGADHPNTLISMENLALTYWTLGRWKEAEVLQVAALETMKRVRGQEHPNTLNSMNNLASTYANQGRWKEAEVLQVTILETMKRVCGQEHPNTLISMANLALTYWTLGRWKEAEVLQVAVLETMKRVFGQEHPSTLNSMESLAFTYANQGRWKEAEVLQVAAVGTMKRVLGQEHPYTVINMNSLAFTYANQGRWKEAEVLQVAALETMKRVLGQEHPNTLISMSELALTYVNQGRWKEAEVLQVAALETMKRVFGQEHPSTLISMAYLAYTLRGLGYTQDAIVMMENVLVNQTAKLGLSHPHTIKSQLTLRKWNEDVGVIESEHSRDYRDQHEGEDGNGEAVHRLDRRRKRAGRWVKSLF